MRTCHNALRSLETSPPPRAPGVQAGKRGSVSFSDGPSRPSTQAAVPDASQLDRKFLKAVFIPAPEGPGLWDQLRDMCILDQVRPLSVRMSGIGAA